MYFRTKVEKWQELNQLENLSISNRFLVINFNIVVISMKKFKILGSTISPIFSFLFLVGLIVFAGTILQAEEDPEVTKYFKTGPTVQKLSNSSIEVSWNQFPNANASTHYQVMLNHTYYGSSTKGLKQICKFMIPSSEVSVNVVTFHNGEFCGLSSATTILMPPPVPTGILVTNVATSSFEILWDKVETATSYKIYDSDKLLAQKAESGTNNRLTISNLTEGSYLNVSMTAINNGGESQKSEVIPVQLLPIASMTMVIPNSSITSTSFKVKWTKQEYAKGYKILVNDEIVGETDAKTLEYEVKGLDAGTTVSVKVAIANDAGISATADGIIVQLKPDAPILTVTEISSYSCTLTWSVANGANNYKIFVNGENAIYNVPSTITNVTLTEGVNEGQTYKYMVRAVNDIGESEDSNVVEVTYQAGSNSSTDSTNASASAPLLYNRGMSTSINIPTPAIKGKLLGKNIVVVYFPEKLKGAELGLEVEYLEMLAATPEMSEVKFFGIFVNNSIKTLKNLPNLKWKKASPKDKITIPGKLPVVRFYSVEGVLRDQIRISIPIMTTTDIYKALPEAAEDKGSFMDLYHEQSYPSAK